MRSLLVAAALTASAAGLLAGGAPARADTPPAINPDLLTISGRYGLPKATAVVTQNRLRVGEIKIDANLTTGLNFDGPAFQFALQQGLSKSLVNHGLQAGADAKDPVILQVEVLPFAFTEVVDADGKPGSTTAHAIIRVIGSSTDPALAACVNYEAQGEFKALHRQHSGNGKRTAGVIAGLVVAVINPYAINTFTPESFSNADLENRNLNAQRTVSSNEGISPGFDTKADQSYAALNATQLAVYNYLHHELQDNPACLAAPAPVPVSETKPSDASPAPTATPAVETPAAPAPTATPAAETPTPPQPVTPQPASTPETKASETTPAPAATPAAETPPATPASPQTAAAS
ncbi:MAG TPA: hypothetical protein VG839_01100 [Asticcacaulis sp.]|nr:hypothetical protein [Asticcacaulis sp.]